MIAPLLRVVNLVFILLEVIESVLILLEVIGLVVVLLVVVEPAIIRPVVGMTRIEVVKSVVLSRVEVDIGTTEVGNGDHVHQCS